MTDYLRPPALPAEDTKKVGQDGAGVTASPIPVAQAPVVKTTGLLWPKR